MRRARAAVTAPSRRTLGARGRSVGAAKRNPLPRQRGIQVGRPSRVAPSGRGRAAPCLNQLDPAAVVPPIGESRGYAASGKSTWRLRAPAPMGSATMAAWLFVIYTVWYLPGA